MKKVTMKEIAEKAGISRTTVSFVLNNTPGKSISDTTRDRIFEIAHDLGYFHEKTNQTICIVIRSPFERVAQASYLVEMMRALSVTVDKFGYQVTLLEARDTETFDYHKALQRHKHSGFVLFNILGSEEETIESLVEDGVPVVAIGQTSLSNLNSVDVNNVQAAKQAVQHLIDLGHYGIAMIPYASQEHLVSAHRILGYEQALLDAKIDFDESLVEVANFTSESGYEAMSKLLGRVIETPTAVFVGSDVVALGVMQAIRDADMVIPDDISVVGFDDIPLVQYVTPALTTVSRPAGEIGRITGSILLQQLQKTDVRTPKSILLDSKLIIRGSTAPRNISHMNGKT